MNTSSSHILFCFWHGLGDLILATPSFRAFKQANPHTKMSIAVKKEVIQSRFLEHCPYFDTIIQIPNPWSYPEFETGIKEIADQLNAIKEAHKIDTIKWMYQAPYYTYGIHKIGRTAKEMGVIIASTQTEVFLDPKNEQEARAFLEEQGYASQPYIFVHRTTAFPQKDLPDHVVQTFIKEKQWHWPVIEVGKTYSIQDKPINFTFEILKRAEKVIVADSVFMHAADALGKPIDLAYFSIRPGIIPEVKPLNVPCYCMESDEIKKWYRAWPKKIGMRLKYAWFGQKR